MLHHLGESRSKAAKRFLNLERSLAAKGSSSKFIKAMYEYFDMGHVESVPARDLQKDCKDVYYLQMHVVTKASSTTTKFHIVFDASATTDTGVSLNDQFLVGPTVHSSLVHILLRFRCHKITLTADVRRMYRAVLIPETQRDLHRFVWRENSREPLIDYHMTRLTFGVSASPFTANMVVKQNAIDFGKQYPEAAWVIHESFYVDDGLTGRDTIHEVTELQRQLQELFAKGGFMLRKWKTSTPAALKHATHHLLDEQSTHDIVDTNNFAKVLRKGWNAEQDCFLPMTGSLLPVETLTK